MSWDEYWNGDPTASRAYYEAHKLREKQADRNAWNQGQYIYHALLCVAPVFHAFAKKGTKPSPYPDKPYSFSDDDSKKQQNQELVEEKERFSLVIYMNNIARAVNRTMREREGR